MSPLRFGERLKARSRFGPKEADQDDPDHAELEHGLRRYFGFYKGERLHQSLDYRTLEEVYAERSNGCRSVGS